MSQFKCPQCGGVSYYQESPTIYRCNDCFDKVLISKDSGFFSSPTIENEPQTQNPKQYRQKKNSPAVISNFVRIAIFITIAASTAMMFTSANLDQLTTDITTEPTQSSEELGTEFVPAGRFEISGAMADSIGNIYFVGTFTNDDTRILDFPKFTVELFDESGNSLGTSYAYGEKNFLLSGENTIFNILFENAPKYSTYQLSAVAMPRIYSIEKSNFSLQSLKVKKDKNKGLSLTGQVTNTGDFTTIHTKVFCILFAEDNQIVDYNNVYIEAKDFQSGQKSDFKIDFYFYNNQPKNFYCDADGMVSTN